LKKFTKLLLKSKILILLYFLFAFSYIEGKEQTIYQFEFQKITGEKVSFNSFKGKPLLIVNIATQCGYTPQLESLQRLNKKYKPRGLIILGVPSNDFGGQTPEENKKVESFCKDTYGVSFPLTTKMIVSGVKKNNLFQFLTRLEGEISWNFEKFLINRKGELKKRFRSAEDPLGDKMIKSLEELF